MTSNEQVTIIYESCHMEMKIVTFDRKFEQNHGETNNFQLKQVTSNFS